MKTKTLTLLGLIARVCLFANGALSMGACAMAYEKSDDGVPTWEEFKAETPRVPTKNGDYYIFDGDIGLAEEQLRAYYDSRFTNIVDKSAFRLWGEALDSWPISEAQNLTYCVSNSWPNKAQALADFREAAAQWMSVGAVLNFVYVPAEDDDCDYDNTSVAFNVMPPKAGDCGLGCWRQSSNCEYVTVNYSCGYGNYTWLGVWTHEVGHRLGYTHEQWRSECTSGGSANVWAVSASGGPLDTGYDPLSAMHSNVSCDPGTPGASLGISPSSGQLSLLDRSSAGLIYGDPDYPEKNRLSVLPASWLLAALPL